MILCYSNHFSDSLTSDQVLGWIRCLQVHKICLYLLAFKICLECKGYVAWKYAIFKFCLYVSFEMNKTAKMLQIESFVEIRQSVSSHDLFRKLTNQVPFFLQLKNLQI